jgi:predicted DNA-binding ribbon-helix-helix protein
VSGQQGSAEPLHAGETRLRGLTKRSVSLAGHRTSLALEPEFWAVLQAMAGERSLSLAALVAGIDAGREGRPLASACRVAALAFLRRPAQP